jgi:hypothetical protein
MMFADRFDLSQFFLRHFIKLLYGCDPKIVEQFHARNTDVFKAGEIILSHNHPLPACPPSVGKNCVIELTNL